METKLQHDKLEFIRCKLGYFGLFVVDCIGKSGGLALLWNDELTVEIQNFSQHTSTVLSQPRQIACHGNLWAFMGTRM